MDLEQFGYLANGITIAVVFTFLVQKETQNNARRRPLVVAR